MPVILFYRTDWEHCILHGCPRGQADWRSFPFQDVPHRPGWKRVEIDAEGVEFVVCDDKKTAWDKPAPSYGAPNYLLKESGQFTLLDGQLRRLRKSCVLIVTDLDHTFVGHDGKDPGDLFLKEIQTLWQGEFVMNSSSIAYSTGRNLQLALEIAAQRGLLRPELLICGVGTEIYLVPSHLHLNTWWKESEGLLCLEPDYKKKMETGFSWPEVKELLLKQFPKFEIRGNPEHDPYRIPTAYEVDENLESGLQELRQALGPSLQVIASGEGSWRLVDICSADGGKLKAMEFAMKHLGFSPSQTLACGDSGNDELMYHCQGAKAVMVGNAQEQLVHALTRVATSKTELQKGKVFETEQGCTVLYSNREVAGGIVEALDLFFAS